MKSSHGVGCWRAGLAAAVAWFFWSSAQASTVYLVGFELYKSAADGTAINDPYFYTTNPNIIGAAREMLTPSVGPAQTTSISFSLDPGDNIFTFSPDFHGDPGAYAGVELFFNDTGTSYNPNVSGVRPDLAAYLPTGSSPLAYPGNGIEIIDYGNSFGALVPYGGATSFTVDTQIITLTDLSIDHEPAGSFTLNVAPVPEPAAVVMTSLAGLYVLIKRKALYWGCRS